LAKAYQDFALVLIADKNENELFLKKILNVIE